jgi:hypothetical protein
VLQRALETRARDLSRKLGGADVQAGLLHALAGARPLRGTQGSRLRACMAPALRAGPPFSADGLAATRRWARGGAPCASRRPPHPLAAPRRRRAEAREEALSIAQQLAASKAEQHKLRAASDKVRPARWTPFEEGREWGGFVWMVRASVFERAGSARGSACVWCVCARASLCQGIGSADTCGGLRVWPQGHSSRRSVLPPALSPLPPSPSLRACYASFPPSRPTTP